MHLFVLWKVIILRLAVLLTKALYDVEGKHCDVCKVGT